MGQVLEVGYVWVEYMDARVVHLGICNQCFRREVTLVLKLVDGALGDAVDLLSD